MTTTAQTTTCTRCGSSLVLAASGRFVTGSVQPDGSTWILPSHLNSTCDGVHLHQNEEEVR
jgi:hypothetical protein